MTYLVAFLLAFLVAAILTPILRALAPIIGGIDNAASSRKVHSQPIPRIGGLAIVVGFYLPLVGLFVYRNDISALILHNRWLVSGLFGGGLTIAALGFFDDLKGVRAIVKLGVQVGVALLLWHLAPTDGQGGFQIHAIAGIQLGVLSLPVTVFWVVGIINALNLIDGLDGLAGGVAAIAIGLNFAIAYERPDVLMCVFMAALGGAVLGFLLYNFNPATIFMGDSGSMFLGFVLATTSTAASQKGTATLSMLVPIIGLGLPIADTLLAIVRRTLRGRPIFSADREHIHHKLLAMGLTQRRAVLALYGVCLVFAGVALVLNYAQGNAQLLVLSAAAVAIVAALRRLGYLSLDPEKMKLAAQARSRNQNLRGVVREIGSQLRSADGVELVWESVKYLAPAMKAREMRLSIDESRTVNTWRDPDGSDRMPPCIVRIPLERRAGAPGGQLGNIEVRWTDGRSQIDRDDEIALEMVKDHVESALDRLLGDLPAGPRDVGGDSSDTGNAKVLPLFQKRA